MKLLPSLPLAKTSEVSYPPRPPQGWYWLEPGESIEVGDLLLLSVGVKTFTKEDLQPWGGLTVRDIHSILRKIPRSPRGYRWVRVGERLRSTDLIINQNTGKWVRTILSGEILYDRSSQYIYIRKRPKQKKPI